MQGRWGLGDAILGFVVGVIASSLAVVIWVAATGSSSTSASTSTVGATVAGLVGLWVGLAGAPVLASRLKGAGRLALDFGFRLRAWPDVPLGVGVGLGSQLILLPVLYIPVRVLVPHLDQQLGQPAQHLTGGADTGGLVVLGIFVVLGAPLVEELFFRGLLLRSLEKTKGLASLGRRACPAVAVLVSAVAFGLAHLEVLQLLGLAAFGVVLGVLAERWRRLGPGMVAHATFNAVTVIVIALAR
ncbi:MAG: CPBP family intramembrane metalloprotease [Actinobacteria bacterium]|nr:MAG: CPBP family intramembrane metalloprotease [Actinomycetota bacterium]